MWRIGNQPRPSVQLPRAALLTAACDVIFDAGQAPGQGHFYMQGDGTVGEWYNFPWVTLDGGPLVGNTPFQLPWNPPPATTNTQ